MGTDKGTGRREPSANSNADQNAANALLQNVATHESRRQEKGRSGTGSYDHRQHLEGDVYSNGTELYMESLGNDQFLTIQDIYGQDHVATPKGHTNLSQIGSESGSFLLNQGGDHKEQVLHYAADKYGPMVAYSKPQKAAHFGYTVGGDFYLPPPAQTAPSQPEISFTSWNPRDFSMYQHNTFLGNDSGNSTIDGDSVEDAEELVGPDGTMPPANKRDPIYTAISGLKWKAKSKKWVVRWDNPITNRRVYKYFSGIRYGFMEAHKRAKYYLEFLNASVGRLEAPSVGNPFCRRIDGPPKGKANKGLIRKLMTRNRAEIMFKNNHVMYGYNGHPPYSNTMKFDVPHDSNAQEQPMYRLGSSMNDPYCIAEATTSGY
ncbi:AP2 domain transcription factor AP2VIII-2 [Babesia ovata]|uniref:AP2 domain transcription factor AP2VIII-2 n=1 Tax=Babesia ovata TaxID=189622 RepID=A0A2H6K7B0_9APIC|nr:AP2 domain transcription factor AP2VIII-2 [Babesia ovata]GBE58883.1 AP2 domain transcription factor AP2VIII-2 [Babesia ovata]